MPRLEENKSFQKNSIESDEDFFLNWEEENLNTPRFTQKDDIELTILKVGEKIVRK